MAFNQHLESDSVGDIGFFNFIRAPLGLLLWVLGGYHDEDACKGHGKIEREFSENNESERLVTDSLRFCSEKLSGLHLNQGSPIIARSEVSDMSIFQQDGLHERTVAVQLGPQHALACSALKKKLSWLDESGDNLAFESTQKHEPQSQIVPQRSAMSRSRSVQNRLSGDENSRYLPKGLSKQQHDIVSASNRKKVDPLVDASGLESPQWGWYIRTTPPTPEMYYSRPSSKSSLSSSTASTSSSSTQPNPFGHVPTNSQPNPVFQGLQDRHKASPIGWTGVPL